MSEKIMGYGIDLGTTNSEIAVMYSKPQVIKNNQNADFTPSVVWIDKRGRIIVGQQAKSRAGFEAEHENIAQEFKRKMGIDELITFPGCGQKRRPEELSAEVLKSLKNNVKTRLGEDVRSVVITVPAAFELPQTEATKRAAELAGFTEIRLLQEPIAAATAYGFQRPDDKVYWLVYDLGGGTFDAALIQLKDGVFRVVEHAGDNFLGGKDIDHAIIDNILVPEILRRQGRELPGFQRGNDRYKAIFAKLKAAAEEAKIMLSDVETATIYVDPQNDEEGFTFEYEITRAQVAKLVEPTIRKSIRICKEVIEKANLKESDIERLILVGGPTLAPYVREYLQILDGGLQIQQVFSVDPITVVAQGAAIFASSLGMQADQSAPRPSDENFDLKLNYQPVGNDMEPIIGGNIIAKNGGSLSGYTVHLQNTEYDSGAIPLSKNGGFMLTLRVEADRQNVFDVILCNVQGDQVCSWPSILTYVVGNAPTGQSLMHNIGVSLANNEVAWYFKKGETLPKKAVEHFKTSVAVRKGTDDVITIPIVEGDNSRADRNRLIGKMGIGGEQFPRDLPAGAEVEVKVVMSEDRTVTTEAYIPMLDKEFEKVWDIKFSTVDATELRLDLNREKDRLDDLQRKAEDCGDGKILTALDVLENERVVANLENTVQAAVSDSDARSQAEKHLLDLKVALDEIEEVLEWPALVAEAEDEMRMLAEVAAKFGNTEQKKEAMTCQNDLRQAMQTREVDLVRRKIDQCSGMRFSILYETPGFQAWFFDELRKDQARMNDQREAQRWFNEGQRAIQDSDLERLQRANWQLLQLLPREVQARIQQGYGSTLVR